MTEACNKPEKELQSCDGTTTHPTPAASISDVSASTPTVKSLCGKNSKYN